MAKKILAFLLVVSLTAAVAIGGTLAYLTDRDSEANVFTVGDVNIDLNESFNHGAALIPGVDIEKKPTVTNVGPNDAWVWASIAVPSALDNDDASKNVIHFNYSKDAEYNWTWTNEGQWLVTKNVPIDGVNYNVYTALYDEVLKKGETTKYPVIYKVYMDNHIDIDPDGNWHHVENGVVSEKLWSTADGNPIIYVSAYAMQTEGFDTALDAYKAYNEQWTTASGVNNGLEWANPIPADVTIVKDAGELAAAIAEGKSVALSADITVNGTNMITIPKQTDAIVNLNGHKITADFSTKTDGASAIFTIDKNATLTINGEGKVHVTAAPTTNYVSSVFTNLGTLVVNGGEYSMTYGTYDEGYLIPTIIDTNSNIGKATTTINGGTFTHTRNMFRNFAQPLRGENNATLIINGGTFNGKQDDYATIWNQKTSGSGVDGDGIVIINGGTFNYVDVENDFTTGVTVANGIDITVK